MAIVYKHYKKTNNELFYIGIGADEKRAFSERSRNDLWHNIVLKHGYYVKLYKINISYNYAKKIEIELIKKYGRIDNNTGILCNMTNGGDGNTNMSESTRLKISNSLKGIKQTEETKLKRKISCKKSWDNDELKSIQRQRAIENHIKGIIGTKGIPSKKKGIPFMGDKEKISISLKKYYKHNSVHNKNLNKVLQFDLNNFLINEFDNPTEAAKTLNNGDSRRIIEVCNGKRKTHKGYIFKYK